MALFYILLTIVLWGVGSFFGRFAMKTATPNEAYVLEALGSVSLALIFALFFRKDCLSAFQNFNIHAFLFGAFLGAGTITFILALKYKPASEVVPLSALYLVITTIMGYFILSETVTLFQGIGILFAILACMLIA